MQGEGYLPLECSSCLDKKSANIDDITTWEWEQINIALSSQVLHLQLYYGKPSSELIKRLESLIDKVKVQIKKD
jgi:hypothetical protein